jgi:hypothetical protein
MGLRSCLDWCGNSCLHQDSILGLSSLYRVAVSATLSRPATVNVHFTLSGMCKCNWFTFSLAFDGGFFRTKTYQRI